MRQNISISRGFAKSHSTTTQYRQLSRVVRIRTIVRRITNPPIRNAHICPCDSAGYLNEFLCTNSQTDHTNGLEERVGRLQRRLFLGRQGKGKLGHVVQIRVCRFT